MNAEQLPTAVESVCRFGPEEGMVGILSEPWPAGADTDAMDRPVVLLANVGLNHRVGPSRAWVELARCLSRRGFATLRFDLSGLGDSDPRCDTQDDHESACRDVRDAILYLSQARGARRFVLGANCSGTDSAHAVATEDERVVGAFFLDGYSYPTPESRVRHALRILDWRRYRRRLRLRHPEWFGLPGEAQGRTLQGVEPIWVRDYPPRERVEADLQRMLARGARLLFIYTGESSNLYKNQLFDTFALRPRERQVELEFWADASHTYRFSAGRQRLVARVAEWMQRCFASTQSPTQAT